MGGLIQINWHAWRYEDYAEGGLSNPPTDRYPLPCPDKNCSICYKEKKMNTSKVIPMVVGKDIFTDSPRVEKIRYVKHPEKGASQMMAILDLLEEHKKPIAVSALLEELAQYSKLVTKQTPKRIFDYYQNRMLDNGYIEIVLEDK